MAKIFGTNQAAGKVLFSKEAATKVKSARVTVKIDEDSYSKLLKLAYIDGYEPIASTDKGASGENKRTVAKYVDIALADLFAKRAADLVEKEETETES